MYCKVAAFSTSSCLRIPMLNLEMFSENKNAALICDHLGGKWLFSGGPWLNCSDGGEEQEINQGPLKPLRRKREGQGWCLSPLCSLSSNLAGHSFLTGRPASLVFHVSHPCFFFSCSPPRIWVLGLDSHQRT